MTILGIHHITLVSSNAQRTVDFYTQVLGQRFVKRTINFDDPTAYHLYFGNETGAPGTAITFFEWTHAPQGKSGIGGTHHFAMRVKSYDALLKWKRRLLDLGLSVQGPFDRHYFKSIYFADPDGVILEIATDTPGWTVDEAADALGKELREPPAEMVLKNRDHEYIKGLMWGEPVPEITQDMALMEGMHHISAISANIERTNAFYSDLLGMRLVKKTANFDDPTSAHWYWGNSEGEVGSIITYFERDPRKTSPVRMGAGQTHHFALAVADEETQLQWREKLLSVGVPVSPVRERVYFKSIYMNDPDGHIVEIATLNPGFAVDEDVAHLGEKLMLPPWLERSRAAIEANLPPLTVPKWNPAK